MKLSKKEKDFYQQLDVNITISESTHIDMVVEEVYPKLKMANDNARISKLNLKLILLNLYKNYQSLYILCHLLKVFGFTYLSRFCTDRWVFKKLEQL